MHTHSRDGLHHFTIRLLFALSLCLAAGLLMVSQAQAGGAPQLSAPPLNPAFLESLVSLPIGVPSGADVGQALGSRPGPQDFSRTAGMQVPGVRALALPATYDLRTLGRVTPVKNQNPYGTCWSFAACGSLESCILASGALPPEIRDFSEDNMVLTSGFNYPGTLYDAGGQIWMSTSYLARWGGPVYESDDAYGDIVTPPGLTPRKHVQEVNWIPPRGSATDNDNIKTAVMTYGAADVSMGWYGSSAGSSYYNAATASYYYNGSDGTNHEVLIVGWDDNYAAANFATTPPGNGAFIVKNSWGTTWGSSGYFYVSYYDSKFGRGGNPEAVFNGVDSTDNYSGIYQYDPLGYVTALGYGESTVWFANVFTAQATAWLSAVGFYSVVPGASYEVHTGSSLATKTLSTSGTLAYMGYHTVTLPAPVAVTNGQPFAVAVKMTSPGYGYPVAVEYPLANYSSGATAAFGQSYLSQAGSIWTDVTTWNANANVCLKAYVKTSVPPTVTGFTPTSGPVGTPVTITGTQFTGATAVRFNGTAATTFIVDDPTQITATVPAGATTGTIAVTTPGGTGTSAGSFTVTPPPTTIAVTAPNGGESWVIGYEQTVSWTTSPAMNSGLFALWAVSSGGTHYWIGSCTAVAGQTNYSLPWLVGPHLGAGYTMRVSYGPAMDAWTATDYSDSGFTIGPTPTISVTAPNDGDSFVAGSMQTVSWITSPTQNSGRFALWAVSTEPGAAHTWLGYRDVVAGQVDYDASVRLDLPAGSYRLRVSYYYVLDTWVATSYSVGAFTITEPTPTVSVTSPNGGESWARGSAHNLTWTVSSALTTGNFRLLLYDSSGAQVSQWLSPLIPASGLTSYSRSWTITQAAGTTWKVRLYYYDAGGA